MAVAYAVGIVTASSRERASEDFMHRSEVTTIRVCNSPGLSVTTRSPGEKPFTFDPTRRMIPLPSKPISCLSPTNPKAAKISYQTVSTYYVILHVVKAYPKIESDISDFNLNFIISQALLWDLRPTQCVKKAKRADIKLHYFVIRWLKEAHLIFTGISPMASPGMDGFVMVGKLEVRVKFLDLPGVMDLAINFAQRVCRGLIKNVSLENGDINAHFHPQGASEPVYKTVTWICASELGCSSHPNDPTLNLEHHFLEKQEFFLLDVVKERFIPIQQEYDVRI
jgi:hypothetical protein